MGLEYTRRDQIQFQAHVAMIHWLWPLLPQRLRQTTKIREAKGRALARAALSG
jgi:hypothetical protein